MHIQTHILSSWCLGNLAGLNRRERTLCILAGSLPDLDGLGIIFNRELYWDYHHITGHNIFAGLLICSILTIFSKNRIKAFATYLGLFHFHFLLDYFGSGPGWGISYLWPLSNWQLMSDHAWEFYSWQNITTGYFFTACTLAIIPLAKRTPLEVAYPSLDRKIVTFFRKLLKLPPD